MDQQERSKHPDVQYLHAAALKARGRGGAFALRQVEAKGMTQAITPALERPTIAMFYTWPPTCARGPHDAPATRAL